MLLLSALCVDRETILEDYLLTNESNAHIIEAVRKEYESYGIAHDKLKAMIFASGGVFADYMDLAIDTLDKKYGSVTGYLQKELGLTEDDTASLQKKFLIPQ